MTMVIPPQRHRLERQVGSPRRQRADRAPGLDYLFPRLHGTQPWPAKPKPAKEPVPQ